MDLSIIIVSYNTKKMTDDCLSSIYRNLKNSSISFEIIVVDNVSKDGSVEMIEKKYKKVRIIKNTENVGFGKANNQGIKVAEGTMILLLNSDTVVLPNAIQKLYQFSVKNKNSFIGPKLLNFDRSSQTSCGPFLTLPVVFAALFLKGDHVGITRWSPNRLKQVDWVSGACILAPRSLFMDDLLFDEEVFMYMDEIDLLYRAKLKGYKTLFYPGSEIIHIGRGSSDNEKKGPVIQIFKGLTYFYKKHYSILSQKVLRVFLKTKARISYILGVVSGNTYLKETYDEAYRVV